jgi:glycosyltransferase involved in cell wall biosynthesis
MSEPHGAHRGRILFVEQFYFPEGWGGAELPRDLTCHLARGGLDVTVICGSDQYVPVRGDPGEDPASQGVTVLRLPALVGGDLHSRKFLRQVWFYLGLLPKLLLRRPPDVFVSQTNPPMAVPLVAFAARLWRRPYLIIAMDLYPEVLLAHGSLQPDSLLLQWLDAMFRSAYRSATRVVTLGPIMSRRLLQKGVEPARLVEISNWSTGSEGVVRGRENSLRAEWGLQDDFVLVYSGNLGIGHEFETLLHGFAIARQRSKSLKLVIIGKGSRLNEVRQLVRELDLGDAVRFSDLLPAARLPESMGLADLAVVTLREGFEGLIVPSKLLGCMARGLPVLYVGPVSDTSAVIGRYQCGICVEGGDSAGLAAEILAAQSNPDHLDAMGNAGLAAYDAYLARGHGLRRYEQVVHECLQSKWSPAA